MKKLAAILALTFTYNAAPATAKGVYQLELLWEIHILSARCTLVDEQYLAFKVGTARELEAAGYGPDHAARATARNTDLMPADAINPARCRELVRPLMSAYLATLE